MPTSKNFIVAAEIAAKLSEIYKISDQLHLSSLNAKITTAHLGEKGLGFGPLTEFASTLAIEVSKLTKILCEEAKNLSSHSTSNFRCILENNKFKQVQNNQSLDLGKEGIEQILQKTTKIEKEQTEVMQESYKKVISFLSNLQRQVKAINYLCSNCRIEASRLDEHRENFDAVSDSFEDALITINALVDSSKKSLENSYERN